MIEIQGNVNIRTPDSVDNGMLSSGYKLTIKENQLIANYIQQYKLWFHQNSIFSQEVQKVYIINF